MERVQYSLERSLPQLKLLDEQGLLSKDELRSVTSQRQAFEARLIRRQAEKNDFVQYLGFEDDLNSLVLLRARERMREASAEARLPAAEHKARLLPRHFFSKQAASYSASCIGIFERMVRKFRYDIDAWDRYLQWARARKMRVVAGRVYARALSLHPSHVPLWLSAADYELNGNADTTSARALLQRGLRMNPLVDPDALLAHEARERPPKARKTNQATRALRDPGALRWAPTDYEKDVLRLWVEYFRMELVFIERLRRRWRVLGLDSGAEAAPGLSRDDTFTSVRAAAHTVAPEETIADEDTHAAEAEVEAHVPAASLDEHDTFTSEPTAPASNVSIPAGHLQITSGAIPQALVANAKKTVPVSLQLYLYVALLELVAAFPFYDAVAIRPHGEILSLRVSEKRTGSGDVLRARLMQSVLAAMQSTSEDAWSEAGQLSKAVVQCLHPLMHPFSHSVQADLEWTALPASAAETELEQNGLLHGASRIHTAFSAPIDSLYELAVIPPALRMSESGEGVLDAWNACRPVYFLLQLASQRLVVRTVHATEETAMDEDSDSVSLSEASVDDRVDWHATPYLTVLAESGDLPVLMRTLVMAFRKQLPSASADQHEPLALAFLATLRFLANPTRAGIEEENLRKYVQRAERKLLDTLLRDGPHLDLAWLAIEQLIRRSQHADDDEALSSLFAEAQQLVETDALHPGAWALYERTGRQVAERHLPGADAAAPFGFTWTANEADAGTACAAWRGMLEACTSATLIAQDTSAPVWGPLILWLGNTARSLPEEAGLLAPPTARIALWLDFLAWVQRAADVRDVLPKHARRAARWAWSTMERAVAQTGALLASSHLVGTARAHAQTLHDAVVLHFFLFSASAPARAERADAAEAAKSASKDRALHYLLQHSTASTHAWLELARRESALLAVQPDAARAGLEHRSIQLYERALAQSERTRGPLPPAAVWEAYLAFFVQDKNDMPGALAALARALPRVRADDPAAATALERAWQALVADA